MNEGKLALLMELSKEYLEVKDEDLATQIIKQVPSIIEEIRRWKQSHIQSMNDQYENQW